jgi:hypothetical protein
VFAGAAVIGGLAALPVSSTPPLAEVLPRAAAFCAAAAETNSWTNPDGTDTYVSDEWAPKLPPIPSRTNAKTAKAFASMATFSDMPMLIQRAVAAGRSHSPFKPSAAIHFPAASGSAWVIVYSGTVCDLYVTGSAAPVAPLAEALLIKFAGERWRTVGSTDTTPFTKRVMVHSAPKPDKPGFGTRASIQWRSTAVAKPDGIQLEINYLAADLADISPTPPAKS